VLLPFKANPILFIAFVYCSHQPLENSGKQYFLPQIFVAKYTKIPT
jgi:hypothetical protein